MYCILVLLSAILLTTQAKALLTDDYGKDLASVETLIRRHEELERDLTAIKDKLEVIIIEGLSSYSGIPL